MKIYIIRENPYEESMKHSLKASVASSIGNLIEWYDFFVYGLAATLIFPVLFFPNQDPQIGVIIGFASYAIGFVFRPVGAMIFGHIGDIYGRRKVLATSLLLMGVCTFLIGCLPTYNDIGIFAPIILLGLRCIQGLALGGEWGSASTMTYEHAPVSKKGSMGGWIQVGVPLGILFSTSIFAVISSIFGDQGMLEFGWRVPFLLSMGMVVVGLYVRLSVQETPEFLDNEEKATSPIMESIRTNWRPIIAVAMYRMFQNTVFNILSLYAITFLFNELHYSKKLGTHSMIIGSACSVVAVLVWARLSDTFKRDKMFVCGCLLTMAFIPLFFMGLTTLNPYIITLVYVVAFIFHDIMYSIQASHIPEQFTARLRLTSSNLSYNLGGALAGATSILLPIIYAIDKNIWHLIAFVCATGLISLTGGLMLRK
jgi:MHS family shikimate/dehydroshikimate transporter-like MFS transporter